MTTARGRRLHLLCVAFVLPACASLAPRPTELDLRRAPPRSPPITLADLEHGRTVYLRRCASCHRPFEPASKPADRWPLYVEKMKERAHLADADVNLVVDYLVTMAHP